MIEEKFLFFGKVIEEKLVITLIKNQSQTIRKIYWIGKNNK